jgi:hypothetical protein
MRHDRTRIASTALFMGLWAALVGSPATCQESAETRLQTAIYKQQVEGDVRGAIELLRRIASERTTDRTVVARALLQLGLAHELLERRIVGWSATIPTRKSWRARPARGWPCSRPRRQRRVRAPTASPPACSASTGRAGLVPEPSPPMGANSH